MPDPFGAPSAICLHPLGTPGCEPPGPPFPGLHSSHSRVFKAPDLAGSPNPGASEPRNMIYMSRLGIWGDGTPFRTFEEFLHADRKSVV